MFSDFSIHNSSFLEPSVKIKISSSAINSVLKEKELTLSSTNSKHLNKIRDISLIAQKQFKEFISSGHTFCNIPKRDYMHLPKMHFFFDTANKVMRLYLKIPSAEPKKGAIKACHQAICLTFSPDEKPVAQKVARVKVVKVTDAVLKRVGNEISCLKLFKGKKRVCQLLDHAIYKDHRDQNKCVMYEWLYKGTLLEAGQPSDPLKGIFKEILEGTITVHEKGFVHRDLKPGNIFTGPLALGDFDLVVKADHDGRLERSLFGTLRYFSPEHLDTNKPFSLAIDYWALGCVFHELFYKRPPKWGGSLGLLCNLKFILSKLANIETKATLSPLNLTEKEKTLSLLKEAELLAAQIEKIKPLFTPTSQAPEVEEGIAKIVDSFSKLMKDVSASALIAQKLKKRSPKEFETLFSTLQLVSTRLEAQLRETWTLLEKEVSYDNPFEEIIWGLLHPDPLKRLTDKKALALLSLEEHVYSAPSSPKNLLAVPGANQANALFLTPPSKKTLLPGSSVVLTRFIPTPAALSEHRTSSAVTRVLLREGSSLTATVVVPKWWSPHSGEKSSPKKVLTERGNKENSVVQQIIFKRLSSAATLVLPLETSYQQNSPPKAREEEKENSDKYERKKPFSTSLIKRSNALIVRTAT